MQNHYQTTRISLGATLFLAAFATPATAQTFEGLGHLPGAEPWSAGHGVSSDGRVLGGLARSPGAVYEREPFLWTVGQGMIGVQAPTLVNGVPYAEAFGLSGNGEVLVGSAKFDEPPQTPSHGFAWSRKTGYSDLGTGTGSHRSEARATSFDGSVTVGSSRLSAGWGVGAPVWSEATVFRAGAADLAGSYPGGLASELRGISDDGRVAVGYAERSYLEGRTAVIWTEENGLVSLGDLPGGYHFSEARAASRDGSVVVGYGTVSFSVAHVTDQRAMRWTEQTGMVALPDIPGGHFTSANAVSDDGRVVVGWVRKSGTRRAALWDPALGAVDLHDLLEAAGYDMTDWKFTEATAISGDGKTVTGYGIRTSLGAWEAWRVTLP